MSQSQSKSKIRVPVIQKVAWGIAGLGDNMLAWSIVFIAQPIYNIALGVDPAIIGWSLALPRILDAVTDPLAGHWSDNTRTRWGRRKPWILCAGLLATAIFIATWFPPAHASKTVIALYFFLTTSMYLGVYGFFSVPLGALAIEMTTDYHERTRIQAFRIFFTSIGQLIMPWFYKWSLMIGNALPAEGVKPEVIGVRYVGSATGLAIMLCILMPVLFCKENVRAYEQPKINFFEAFSLTFRNRRFLLILGLTFMLMIGFFMANPMAIYIGIYHVFQGDKDAAAFLGGFGGGIYGVVAMLALYPITWLSTRFGKKPILIGGLGIALFGSLSTWVLLTPAHPYWSLLPGVFIGVGQPCVWILGASLVADICDIDELKNGMRREGMFGAVAGLINKGGVGFATILNGYLINFSGFVAGIDPSPQVIWNMRIMYALIPAILVAGAIFLASRIDITESRMAEVRAALEMRKEASASDTPDITAVEPVTT